MSRIFNSLASAAMVTFVSGFLFTGSAGAVTINVDFNAGTNGSQNPNPSGTYSGVGAAPDAGTFWNGVQVGLHSGNVNNVGSPFNSGSLLASDGATNTGVTVSLSASGSGGTSFGAYDVKATPPEAGHATLLMNDFVYVDGTRIMTFTISGLAPNGQYDLYLYSQNGGHVGEKTNFTIGGVTKTAANSAAANSGFVENNNYVKYAGLIAVGGIITGTMDWAGDPNSSFNGFQLVSASEIPEPSSIILAGLAALGGLFVVRRKARKA